MYCTLTFKNFYYKYYYNFYSSVMHIDLGTIKQSIIIYMYMYMIYFINDNNIIAASLLDRALFLVTTSCRPIESYNMRIRWVNYIKCMWLHLQLTCLVSSSTMTHSPSASVSKKA